MSFKIIVISSSVWFPAPFHREGEKYPPLHSPDNALLYLSAEGQELTQHSETGIQHKPTISIRHLSCLHQTRKQQHSYMLENNDESFYFS